VTASVFLSIKTDHAQTQLTADLQRSGQHASFAVTKHRFAEWKTSALHPLAATFCVTGVAIMAAEGRGLGFSLVFTTQYIPPK